MLQLAPSLEICKPNEALPGETEVDLTSSSYPEHHHEKNISSYSALGLDVALEEINHLLEVDLTDNTRPRLGCGENITRSLGHHHQVLTSISGPTSEERTQDHLYQPPANEEVENLFQQYSKTDCSLLFLNL